MNEFTLQRVANNNPILIAQKDKKNYNRPALDSRHWYILTTYVSAATVKKELDKLSLMYALEGKSVVEYFMPTCFMRVKQSGLGGQYVTRKMPQNYLFIHSTERAIVSIKKSLPKLNLTTPLSTSTGQRRNHLLPDNDLLMLRKVADVYAGQLPCFRRDKFSIEGCDRVRIVKGPFAGVEGAMVIAQGKSSGQVILPVQDLFLVSTGEIPSNNYVVLEFGQGNRHPYHAFDGYMPRVAKALTKRLNGSVIDDASHADLLKFVGRYCELTTRTVNLESMHAGLMLMSYRALGDEAETERWLERCRELLPRLKAELQIALHFGMMYAVTGDASLAERLRQLIASWGDIPAGNRKKLTAARLLTTFKHIYTTCNNANPHHIQ